MVESDSLKTFKIKRNSNFVNTAINGGHLLPNVGIYNHEQQTLIKLNDSDMRLFSIYGLPSKNDIMKQKINSIPIKGSRYKSRKNILSNKLDKSKRLIPLN